MARSKQIPSTIGYWALLATEMSRFCAAWKDDPFMSRQLHRFKNDWKKVASWGGSKVPSLDSQRELISAAVREDRFTGLSQIPFISGRPPAYPAPHGCVAGHLESRPTHPRSGSLLCARTGCNTGPVQLMEMTSEMLIRIDDLAAIQQAFPDFTSAWLAYARQLLTNRSDKSLVTRVWLHTHEWTQDMDRPDKLRRWTDDGFMHKDIARCIQRDTGVEVSARTVRAVISDMCEEEPPCPPSPHVCQPGYYAAAG